MVEHPDGGLLSCFPPAERAQIIYQPSLKRIEFWTGAVVGMFSAEEPERLRGPKHEKVWGDEVAAWKYGPECMDQIAFGLRIGDRPQMICTTTPKPVKVIRDLVKDKHTVITLGGSYENRENLSRTFFETIVKKYEGTRLGDQELRGMLLEDLPGALWTRAMIDRSRCQFVNVPPLCRVVVAIDPAVTANEDSDETGIGAVGLSFDGHLFVLEDCSIRGSPHEWGVAAVKLLVKWRGDRIVAEVNNGGDLVEGNLRTVAPNIPFRAVHATRRKLVRAEPVAALYEQNRVHHVGSEFSQLEDQLCSWVPNAGMKSPDRMDWLVWAITDLLVQPAQEVYRVTHDEGYQISPY
jgi:phage terminase large subunit-like protein